MGALIGSFLIASQEQSSAFFQHQGFKHRDVLLQALASLEVSARHSALAEMLGLCQFMHLDAAEGVWDLLEVFDCTGAFLGAGF